MHPIGYKSPTSLTGSELYGFDLFRNGEDDFMAFFLPTGVYVKMKYSFDRLLTVNRSFVHNFFSFFRSFGRNIPVILSNLLCF